MYVPGNEYYFTLAPAGVLGDEDKGQNIFRRLLGPTCLGSTYRGRDLPGVFPSCRSAPKTSGHALNATPRVS
jgi:hypothetical protein